MSQNHDCLTPGELAKCISPGVQWLLRTKSNLRDRSGPLVDGGTTVMIIAVVNNCAAMIVVGNSIGWLPIDILRKHAKIKP